MGDLERQCFPDPKPVRTITIPANCATHLHYEKAEDYKSGKTFVNVSVDSKAEITDVLFNPASNIIY
jgi:hypothetical protein